MAEKFHLTLGMDAACRRRKETIERFFADDIEKHEMRHTQLHSIFPVAAELGLIFACMSLKKRARWEANHHQFPCRSPLLLFPHFLLKSRDLSALRMLISRLSSG